MTPWLRRWGWPSAKALLAVAILAFVAREFAVNLGRLDLATLTVRPAWLALSAVLYLVALSASAWYWYHLLRVFGEGPWLLAAVRAYFISHLGKYVPGKAWVLFLRGHVVQIPGAEVRVAVAVVTSFIEVLTTMASGAMLAAVLFAVHAVTAAGGETHAIPLGSVEVHPVLLGAALVAVLGVPLLPAVFNRLVARLARRFQKVEAFKLPRLRPGTLALGLAVTGVGWCLTGVSVWALVQAVVPEPPNLTADLWARYTAAIALGYVAGFLALVVPSGIGVRELVLEIFLAPTLAPDQAVGRGLGTLVALLLRLTWTAAELVTAVALFWVCGRATKRIHPKGPT